MESLTLNVPTVHCNSCKLTIEESLEELAGVADSAVNLDTKQVTVAYDPGTVDIAAITATIDQSGYPVSP